MYRRTVDSNLSTYIVPEIKLQTYYCCRVKNFGFGDFTGTICSRLEKPKKPNSRKTTNLKNK